MLKKLSKYIVINRKNIFAVFIKPWLESLRLGKSVFAIKNETFADNFNLKSWNLKLTKEILIKICKFTDKIS